MCNENIINKIKNLLNMTVGNGCSENEANAAFELARKLMLKHKLEEKDLNTTTEIVTCEIDTINYSIPWIHYLFNVIALNFGVLKYTIKISPKVSHIVLFGKIEDVTCVKEICKCAKEYAEQKANKYGIEHRKLFGTSKGYRSSWLYGFVSGLEDKYTEQNKSSQYELMVIVDKQVKSKFVDFTKNFDKKVTKVNINKSNVIASEAGYHEGKKFGTTPLSENNIN